jgi:hypothetical protein
MKSVYSAVRTGALNKAVCGLCVKGSIIHEASKQAPSKLLAVLDNHANKPYVSNHLIFESIIVLI